MSDTLVKCTVCGREEYPNFAGSLRNGWPECCGYTMSLLRTNADIESAAASVVTAQAADFDATVKGLGAMYNDVRVSYTDASGESKQVGNDA